MIAVPFRLRHFVIPTWILQMHDAGYALVKLSQLLNMPSTKRSQNQNNWDSFIEPVIIESGRETERGKNALPDH